MAFAGPEATAADTTPQPFPGDPEITPDLVRQHGLTHDAYERVLRILGRTPTFTELGVFSALWSEHCSYTHSRPLLKTLPTTGERVVQGPGENAGVLRLRDGWAVAFKIESHNHPSAVEPYQGAATGVGGILRDVFTMGARPVALLNSLRFGPLDDGRNRYLMTGVVRGIGDYGNCVGVPTIGGEVDFSPSYGGNPIVNAMCIGVLREDDLMTARARGVGNVLLAIGAKTGRDGIHGASFASEELTAESEARRPQVQVGDPFTEKLLLEASLELSASGCIVAMQDMGAAGLTSSSAEMAARGGVGVEMNVALVPTRESGMSPYEILLSESQERMLVVAAPDRVVHVQRIAEKWELDATPIGRLTDDGMYRVLHGDRIVAEIPGESLVTDAPIIEAEGAEGLEAQARRSRQPTGREPDVAESLRTMLDNPGLAGKHWVYEQYDSTVRAATVQGPGGDAGVIVIPGTALGIAAATDGNSRYVLLDPYEGGKACVAEAARNVACAGATPIGLTNCLNFGSPERPEIFYQFRETIRGIREACEVLGTPVTGGNVSFYNESPGGSVDPTPVIGMLGMLDDVSLSIVPSFSKPGDIVILLGTSRGHLGGSAYWAYVRDVIGGSPPPVDLDAENALIHTLVALARHRLIASAHDVSDGGLALALAESCIGSPYHTHSFGARLDLRAVQGSLPAHAILFGEDHGRAIVSAAPSNLDPVLQLARQHAVPAMPIGVVTDSGGSLDIALQEQTLSHDVPALRAIQHRAIARRLDVPPSQSVER